MNMMIGLCHNDKAWPNILRKHGYKVVLVEPTIPVNGSTNICPDIVAVSNRQRHALVIDCKGGMNLDPDQDARYSKIGTKKLYSAKAKPDLEGHDMTYAINSGSQERIAGRTCHPIIVFSEYEIRKLGEFKGAIEKLIKFPVPLNSACEPMDYYPFSVDDKDPVIAEYILQGMSSLLFSGKFDGDLAADKFADGILQSTHGCYEFVSERTINKLKDKIKNTIKEYLLRDPDIEKQASEIKNEEDPDDRKITRLMAACAKRFEKKIAHTRITENFEGRAAA